MSRSLVAGLVLLAAGSVSGQEIHLAAPDAGLGDGGAFVPASAYQGVDLDNANLPPRRPSPVAAPPRIVWSGFQVRDGVPTIFLEMTGQPNWTVNTVGNRLNYRFSPGTVPLRNNRRTLETVNFGTAVKRVTLTTKGRDVVLSIELAHPLSHREHFQPAAGGYQMFVIELI